METNKDKRQPDTDEVKELTTKQEMNEKEASSEQEMSEDELNEVSGGSNVGSQSTGSGRR